MTLTGGHSSRKYWRVSYIMIASSTFAHKQHCLTEPMQRSVAQNVFNQHITLPERRMGKKLTPPGRVQAATHCSALRPATTSGRRSCCSWLCTTRLSAPATARHWRSWAMTCYVNSRIPGLSRHANCTAQGCVPGAMQCRVPKIANTNPLRLFQVLALAAQMHVS